MAVAVQNYITAIIIFLVVEMLMTWGFYGMSISHDHICIMANLVRLRKPERGKRRLKSVNDCCGCPERCAELVLVLLVADCLHGLWSCKTQSRQDHDLRALAGSCSFLFWLDLLYSKLDHNAR
jgi:hypothetical protein